MKNQIALNKTNIYAFFTLMSIQITKTKDLKFNITLA